MELTQNYDNIATTPQMENNLAYGFREHQQQDVELVSTPSMEDNPTYGSSANQQQHREQLKFTQNYATIPSMEDNPTYGSHMNQKQDREQLAQNHALTPSMESNPAYGLQVNQQQDSEFESKAVSSVRPNESFKAAPPVDSDRLYATVDESTETWN